MHTSYTYLFFSIVPYLICLVIYVVPLFFVQAYLGQFSSSGFISALRISPLFKGMGYISLAVNITFLMYYGVFAAIPLLFLFHSFRPTLPWSCEAFQELIQDLYGDEDARNLCDFKKNYTIYEYDPLAMQSVIFFRSQFNDFDFLDPEKTEFAWSWQLIVFTCIVWALIAYFFYKNNDLEKISLYIRYSIWFIATLLLLCLLRFSFLDGAAAAFHNFFQPNLDSLVLGLEIAPLFVATAFGAGWGVIISLASYNKFQTNLTDYSWIICSGQALIFLIFGLTSFLIDAHLYTITDGTYDKENQQAWALYLSSGSAMANMRFANMWCVLYYSMLTLSAMLMIVIQLLSIFTAAFDDFECLRMRKKQFIFGLIGLLALSSIYFCSNHGLNYIKALGVDTIFTQTALNLLLILVVLWIYGRERFQRDIELMLNQKFPTWRVNILRFVAPIALIISLLVSLATAYYEHLYASTIVLVAAIFMIAIPWLFVPGYAAFQIYCQRSTVTFWKRFKNCSQPADWYPVETEQRQLYEEAIENVDNSQQLNKVGANIL